MPSANKAKQIEPLTRLAGKHHSPLVLRKYTKWGPPMWIALITDDNLDNLDDQVVGYMESLIGSGMDWEWPAGIQAQRDLAGGLTNHLARVYNKVEGAAVILSADKMLVSSLHGDFMTHGWCRLELFQYLNLSTQI